MRLFFVLLASIGLTVIVGTLIIYEIESYGNYQIDSYLDAVWWTVSTITTVGYGDIVPQSDEGRIASIFFMFIGIGLLSFLISVISNVFVKSQDPSEDLKKELHKEIKLLRKQLSDRDSQIADIIKKLDSIKS